MQPSNNLKIELDDKYSRSNTPLLKFNLDYHISTFMSRLQDRSSQISLVKRADQELLKKSGHTKFRL
ncbi:hypothetical protein SBF1_1200009 [Candidatus Desulfosporosinus infrequens]|uniref:Uncharacterized protein n=1 Tax=Candidatus Desulfosporosinus infrequens TaxID=2043169 RepID=A0A2U3K0G0_9FIRM|nr:hypothetical protein SBF1_1200009 [Candidatus Desulfosporosinus infrequens]